MKLLLVISLFAPLLTSCLGNPSARPEQMYQEFLSAQRYMELQEPGPEGEPLRIAYTDLGHPRARLFFWSTVFPHPAGVFPHPAGFTVRSSQ